MKMNDHYPSLRLATRIHHLGLILIAGSSLIATPSASAGTISVDLSNNPGPYTLTNAAENYTVELGSFSIDYLIVAGGGGGGTLGTTAGRSGGGGAGGLLQGTALSITGSQAITVGAGGTAPNASSGNNGKDSVAFGFTAIGGGGGARSGSTAGKAGGSGGGGGVTGGGGAGTDGQGNDGAAGNGTNAGGGGGAGGAATTYAGGAGLSSSITGTAVTYATGGNGNNANNQGGAAGAANTGDGGDGRSQNASGRAGGSGIVIASYDNTYTELAGGTVTTSGGKGINSFTATGAGTLDLNSATISGNIDGAGNLVWDKTGTLTLSGTNTYTGTTTISAGTLKVNSLGSGNVTVAANGTLASGASDAAPAILQITSNLVLSDGAKLIADYDATTADRVAVSGDLTLGSSCAVTLNAITGARPPDRVTLFTCGGSLSGTVTSWTVTGPDPVKDPCEIRSTANSVYVFFKNRGTMVSFM